MIYIVVLILVAVIAALVVTHFSHSSDSVVAPDLPNDCCGAHEVCESDSLLSSSAQIVYYCDEELDSFKQRSASDYNSKEIEEFREVLYTLNENEVSGWLKSLQIRHIELPVDLRDEALLIVQERRFKA